MRKYVAIKCFAFLGAMLLFCSIFTGCAQILPDEDAFSLVCTIFPAYDWAQQITRGADNVTVTLLADNGADLHSFQPTAADAAQVTRGDLLFAVGSSSDEWALDLAGEGCAVVTMLSSCDTRSEEPIPGVQEYDEDEETDEHVWLSLRCAGQICAALCEELCTCDPSNENIYRTNTDAYLVKLTVLDERYAQMIDDAPRREVLVADRFPFLYLAKDYGLRYCAAFSGCDAESEVTFATVVTLAQEAQDRGLSTLFITETGTDALAKTILETAGINGDTRTLYAMESVTAGELDAGVTYLSRMEDNFETLEGVLYEE